MRAVAAQIIQVMMIIITIISYLPQIIKSLRTKSTDDISIKSWILFTTASTLYLILLLLENAAWRLVVLQIIELSSILTTLIIAIILRKK